MKEETPQEAAAELIAPVAFSYSCATAALSLYPHTLQLQFLLELRMFCLIVPYVRDLSLRNFS